jgi:hypothetical protein
VRARGRVGARGGRRAPGRDGRGEEDDKKEQTLAIAGTGKMTFSAREKAVLDRMEKGEVVRYDPELTLDTLSGYGAAIASDAPLGQVETVVRTMRLMAGGVAYGADSGVTADLTAIKTLAWQRKPVFIHSKAERDWIQNALPKPRYLIREADVDIKKAIVEQVVQGKYDVPGFAELSDVKALAANYHARTFTYRASDSQKFLDKVLSLLPVQGGSAKPAAAQAKN